MNISAAQRERAKRRAQRAMDIEMPANHISPLDEKFITLKNAAILISHEKPELGIDGIIEMLKQAIFRREFDEVRPISAIVVHDYGATPSSPSLLIEASPASWASPSSLPREERRLESLAVEAETIAMVMGERRLLPETIDGSEAFVGCVPTQQVIDKALADLASIPISMYPLKGQALLHGILIAKVKLEAWVQSKGYPMPALQTEFRHTVDGGALLSAPLSAKEIAIVTARRERGRPAFDWETFGRFAREIDSENPNMKRATLAEEIQRRALLEFDEKLVPSVDTIKGHMKSFFS